MRRSAITIAFGLVAAACVGQTPPERQPLPDVEAAIPPPQPCQVVVGTGRGVNVDDVLPDSGAVGVLMPGDLLTSLDGVTIRDSDQLRGELASKAAGDSVTVELVRDGDELEATVTLSPNPEQTGRPLLGVLAVTAFDRLEPEELATEAIPSPFTRAIDIGDEVLLLDPVSGDWWATGQSAPEDAVWVSVPEGLFVLEGAGTADATLVATATGTRIEFGIGDWFPASILGSQGDHVFLSAVRPTEADPSLVQVAVVAADLGAKEVLWLWEVTQQGTGIPVAAHASPDGERLLVGASDQSGEVVRYLVLGGQGQLTVPPAELEAAEGALVLGWFDGESFVALFGDGSLGFIEAGTGTRSELTVTGSLAGAARVWTVGDGQHVLADTGQALIRSSLIEGMETRPLAENCSVGQIGQPGWGA